MKRRLRNRNVSSDGGDIPTAAALLGVLLLVVCLVPAGMTPSSDVLFAIRSYGEVHPSYLDSYSLMVEVRSKDEIYANGELVGWDRMKDLLARHDRDDVAVFFAVESTNETFVRFVDEVPPRNIWWLVLESDA